MSDKLKHGQETEGEKSLMENFQLSRLPSGLAVLSVGLKVAAFSFRRDTIKSTVSLSVSFPCKSMDKETATGDTENLE